MKVHYLQHVPFEGPGYIETWVREQQYEISGTHFYKENYTLPQPDDIDALVVMGGPMSVYDDDKYNWLTVEKAFIKGCIDAGKPVLGVCLGAQLTAVCLGADVHKAPHKEIGWFSVKTTDECNVLPWFNDLFKNHPTVFHWHGDQFDIASGSINLLASAANDNQAFAYNEKILGLQFHLEVMTENVEQLLGNCRDELIPSPFVQTEKEILGQLNHVATMNKMMAIILDRLIGSRKDVHK